MADNPIVWFEIYAQNLARAQAFYETVLNITLSKMDSPVPDLAAALIGVLALITLYSWNSRVAVPVVMLAAGLAGVWVFTK